NLFNNSVDALEGREQQEIRISVKHYNNHTALLTFRDNGCGMSRQTLSRVLDPFFTTKLGRGTGLGLFVVHEIVKGYGGTLEIESEEGRGTTGSLYFPLATLR